MYRAILFVGPYIAELVGPYDKEAISALKVIRARWDPAKKVWYIFSDRWPEMRDAVIPYYNLSVVHQTPPPAVKADTWPWGLLHLAPGAPVEVVKAAHRALALLHHPDRGGDTVTMQKINCALDEILAELGC